MDEKIIIFAELCSRSRTCGLSREQHMEKKRLADEMVADGLMYNDGEYNFTDEKDTEYFLSVIKITEEQYKEKNP